MTGMRELGEPKGVDDGFEVATHRRSGGQSGGVDHPVVDLEGSGNAGRLEGRPRAEHGREGGNG